VRIVDHESETWEGRMGWGVEGERKWGGGGGLRTVIFILICPNPLPPYRSTPRRSPFSSTEKTATAAAAASRTNPATLSKALFLPPHFPRSARRAPCPRSLGETRAREPRTAQPRHCRMR